MRTGTIGVVVILVGALSAAVALAGQHQWKSPARASRGDALRPTIVRPQAVSGPAAGLYCPDTTEGAVGVHDLGWIPAGLNLEINVESFTTNDFDPVAAVVVASVGTAAGNDIKVATFYDNDSGGGKDAKVTLVTPQAGTYLLVVGDNSGNVPGCYRYQASVQ